MNVPFVGRNGGNVSIADARQHLQDILAKVLKTCLVVTQRLLDPPRICITFTLHDGSNNLLVIELLDVGVRLTTSDTLGDKMSVE